MKKHRCSLFLFRAKNIQFLFFLAILAISSINLFADAMFEEHILFEDTDGACAIAAADFNLDGSPDFVYTCNPGHHIKWMENDGEMNFTEHMVIENFLNAKAIDTGCIDDDEYPDFAATANTGNKISWFHNNGDGTFTENVVCTSWSTPGWVLVTDHVHDLPIDINGDGNVDILATACEMGRLGWFENDGNENFTEHIVKDNWTMVSCAVAVDMDDDDDQDILAAAQAGGIVWFENIGDDENFTEHLLFNEWDKPNWVSAGDINGDGHMDFAATSCGNSHAIGWFENDGQQQFTLNMLNGNFRGGRCPLVCDIDEDNDMDIFGIAWQGGLATFYDNDGDQNFTEFVMSNHATDMLKYFVVDLDEDDDLDLIACTAVFEPHHIRWFENIDSFMDADYDVDVVNGHTPVQSHFTYEAYSKPPVSVWEWDFDNDGTIDSTDPEPTHDFTTPGTYDVRLRISNGIEEQEIIKEDLIRVFDGESALQYNYNSSSLRIPADHTLYLGGSFTLESWFNAFDYGMNPTLGNGMIFSKPSFSAYLNNAFPLYNQMTLIVKMIHQDDTQSIVALPAFGVLAEVDYQLAITYDSISDLRIYLNGVLQNQTVYVAPSGPLNDDPQEDLIIGNNGSNTSAFKGVLDEMRVWNVVRSVDDINDHMGEYLEGNEAGLVGYWRCNEGCGNMVADLTANGNDGEMTNCRWHQGNPFDFTPIDEQDIPALEQLSLGNYPNPFNPTTTISFSVPENQPATLEIFNIKGQCLQRFQIAPGASSVRWDGTDENGKNVGSGVYLARLTSGKRSASRRMLMIK